MILDEVKFSMLGENDKAFAKRVYGASILKYKERLIRLGFDRCKRVLDIGSGFGQWSLALSELCREVVAVDSCEVRCAFLEDLVKENNIKNIKIEHQSLPDLTFKPSAFDGVFSYSTMMLTPWQDAVDTIKKILKLEGLFYFNFNSIYWYVYLWETRHNENNEYKPREVVREAVESTLNYAANLHVNFPTQLILDKREVSAYLEKQGFGRILIAAENELYNNHYKENKSEFLKSEYKGNITVYEILASL